MDRLHDSRRDMQRSDDLLLRNTRLNHAPTDKPISYNDKNGEIGQKYAFLSQELKRLYGATGEDKLLISAQKPNIHKFLMAPLNDDDDDPPNQDYVTDNILRDREKEFENRQEEYSERLKNLNAERKRLLEAQENIKEQASRQQDPSAPYSNITEVPDWTFTWKAIPLPKEPPPSAVSAHSVNSVIRNVRKNFPKQREQYYFMRKNHEAELKRLQKLKAPYKGEFGIQTYKKSQLETYKMVRSLVVSEIDRFLDDIFKPIVTAYSKNVQQALIWADKKESEKYRLALLNDNLSQLLSEEILFEVTRKITVEAVKEFFYISAISINISDKVLMNASEIIATNCDEGRDEEDPMYSTVTRLYFGYQEDRKEQRENLWRHNQYVDLTGKDTDDAIEADEQGVDYIEFNQITPNELVSTVHHKFDTDKERDNKDKLDRYRRYELNYWKNITAKLFTISIHKQCRGICTARTSHNHKFMAVGTYHGDIIIYDLRSFPWKAIRAVYNTNVKIEDPVVDVQWSMDGSQLITINVLGTLNLWSFNAGSVSKDDLKGLGLGQADPAGFYCAQLIRQIEMDVDDGHFSYASGPFEVIGVHNDRFGPVLSCFHPSITFFGTQRSMCVALENGDILKCDVESRLHDDIAEYQEIPRIYQPNVRPGVPSYLGSNVEAEMFRQHSHPVIFIGFVDNLMDMVTVDCRGYLNIWKYNKSNVSEYNWFKPTKRMRFRQYKLSFVPVGSAKPNVIFTDRLTRGLTRQQTAFQRQQAELAFIETRLQNHWHSEILPDQRLRTRIYKPEGIIPEAGALFHIVSRHLGTDQISTYITRLYQPVKVAYARFYGVKQSPCGRELVVLKLFPAHAPKRAHFTILRFNLSTLKTVNYRKDVFISEEEYDDYLRNEVVHWDFTRVYGPTGSDYLFLSRGGHLEAFSLATGQLVLKIIDHKAKHPDLFDGCCISSKTLKISRTSRVICAGMRGVMYVSFYEKLQDSIRVLQIVDKNTDVQRRNMWTIFSSLPERRHVAKEQRVNLEDFYLEDLQHPRCYARNIILETMDEALKKKKGFFGSGGGEVTDDVIAEDQTVNYESIRQHVPQLASATVRSRPKGDDLLLSDAEIEPQRRPSELESLPSERASYQSEDYGSQQSSGLDIPSRASQGGRSRRSTGQGSKGKRSQGSLSKGQQGSAGQNQQASASQSQRSSSGQAKKVSGGQSKKDSATQSQRGSAGLGASGGQNQRPSGGQSQKASGGQQGSITQKPEAGGRAARASQRK